MAKTTMKKTLGLTGVTVNAMALIAPGAFLWITYQVQASNNGGATDMWSGRACDGGVEMDAEIIPVKATTNAKMRIAVFICGNPID